MTGQRTQPGTLVNNEEVEKRPRPQTLTEAALTAQTQGLDTAGLGTLATAISDLCFDLFDSS